MIKKFFLFFWGMRRQFSRYFITGLSAVALDIGSLYLLKENFNIRPVLAIIINQIFILSYVFFINKHWSFKSKGMTHKQMMRFLILAGVNYLFSIGWMWVLNEKLGFNYLLVRTANVALAVAWNFLLYRYWVYKYELSDPLLDPLD